MTQTSGTPGISKPEVHALDMLEIELIVSVFLFNVNVSKSFLKNREKLDIVSLEITLALPFIW